MCPGSCALERVPLSLACPPSWATSSLRSGQVRLWSLYSTYKVIKNRKYLSFGLKWRLLLHRRTGAPGHCRVRRIDKPHYLYPNLFCSNCHISKCDENRDYSLPGSTCLPLYILLIYNNLELCDLFKAMCSLLLILTLHNICVLKLRFYLEGSSCSLADWIINCRNNRCNLESEVTWLCYASGEGAGAPALAALAALAVRSPSRTASVSIHSMQPLSHTNILYAVLFFLTYS